MSWADVQTSLQMRGLYTGPLDGIPGTGTMNAVTKLLEQAGQPMESMWDRHPHFKPAELTCRCGCGLCNAQEALLDLLEDVRHHFGDKPIRISSGSRCPEHNKKVGGASGSYHKTGGAADGTITGTSPDKVVNYVKSKTGCWAYAIDQSYFHIDIRR